MLAENGPPDRAPGLWRRAGSGDTMEAEGSTDAQNRCAKCGKGARTTLVEQRGARVQSFTCSHSAPLTHLAASAYPGRRPWGVGVLLSPYSETSSRSREMAQRGSRRAGPSGVSLALGPVRFGPHHPWHCRVGGDGLGPAFLNKKNRKLVA